MRQHATGCTIILFLLGVLTLSIAPIPSILQPLEVLRGQRPGEALLRAIFRRPDSVPRKGDALAVDWAIAEDADLVAATEEDDAPKPELAIAPSPTPRAWRRVERPELEALKRRLGSTAQPIDNPCLEGAARSALEQAGEARAGTGAQRGGGPCPRRALDRFFARLRAAEERSPGAIVRIVHYGDSIIASDHITDMVRQRLQERFGSAGKGFLLVARYNERQRRLRTGSGSKGWRAEHIAQGSLPDRYFGYAGASFTAEADGAETVFDGVGLNRSVGIHYLAKPGAGALEAYADDKLVGSIDTGTAAAAPRSKIATLTLPEGTQRFRLRAKNRGVRLYGVSLEAGVPGVIYESIGVPGASSEVWLSPEREGFSAQLRAREPALLITMLGGNDARTLHQKRRTLEEVEAGTRAFVALLKESVPGADCLIVSPLDAVKAKAGGDMQSRPEVPKVIDIQKRVARDYGCGFWSMYESMGGAGSLERWFRANLFNPDLIHPRGLGGDLLGELLAEALMNAYDERMAGALERAAGTQSGASGRPAGSGAATEPRTD